MVFSSFGALQFVADLDRCLGETARVLRPGGRFAFSITHPTRWMFPDDPDEPGLTAAQSYWDRTPYVEIDDETGVVAYVEHHRTLGDWVGLLAGHGFAITDLLEPEWPEGHDRVWGGWSGTRGRLTPGTAIFGARCRRLRRQTVTGSLAWAPSVLASAPRRVSTNPTTISTAPRIRNVSGRTFLTRLSWVPRLPYLSALPVTVASS